MVLVLYPGEYFHFLHFNYKWTELNIVSILKSGEVKFDVKTTFYITTQH